MNAPHPHPAAVLPRFLEQLETILVGKSGALRLALAGLLARGHLLIEDVPGVGKTTLAQAIAACSGLALKRIQFTSDLLPADIVGVSVYDNGRHDFVFHPGPLFTPVVLADEINRAPPKTQSALLEAMEERHVTVDGNTRALPDPFFVIATQNPNEQVGVYPLPESQLDRFLLRIAIGYPDSAAERELLAGGDRRALIPELAPVCDGMAIRALQTAAAAVHVAPALLDYVQALLATSRSGRFCRLGLSPRSGLALLAASRAWALLAGRDMVVPEDIQAVFVAVAGHRLDGGVGGDAAARSILDTVPVN